MKLIYTLTLLLVVLTSCRVQDSTAPTMEIEEPSYGATFNVGDTMVLKGTFGDNEELNSYSLQIGSRAKDTIAGFNYSENNPISGKEYDYNSEIIIPAAVTDSLIYLHFLIEDFSGNKRNQSHLIRLN